MQIQPPKGRIPCRTRRIPRSLQRLERKAETQRRLSLTGQVFRLILKGVELGEQQIG
jgi:hypothetical protein